MLLFLDGCRARLDPAQLTTAHREGVEKIFSGGRRDGGGGHDNQKRQRDR